MEKDSSSSEPQASVICAFEQSFYRGPPGKHLSASPKQKLTFSSQPNIIPPQPHPNVPWETTKLPSFGPFATNSTPSTSIRTRTPQTEPLNKENPKAISPFLYQAIEKCNPYSLMTPTKTYLQYLPPSHQFTDYQEITKLEVEILSSQLAFELPRLFPKLTSFVIMEKEVIPEVHRFQVDKCKMLEVFVIERGRLNGERFVDKLAKLTGIRKLLIPLEGEGLQSFKKLLESNRNLEALRLDFGEEAGKMLAHLHDVNPKIQHLEISQQFLCEEQTRTTLCSFENLKCLVINESQPQQPGQQKYGSKIPTTIIPTLLNSLQNINKLKIKSTEVIQLFLGLEECRPELQDVNLRFQNLSKYNKCRKFPKLTDLRKLQIYDGRVTTEVVEKWSESKFSLTTLVIQNIKFMKIPGEIVDLQYYNNNVFRNNRSIRRNLSKYIDDSQDEYQDKNPQSYEIKFQTFNEFLSTQTDLQVLKIGAKSAPSNKLLQTISSLPALKILTLNNIDLTPTATELIYLSKLKNLEQFYIVPFGCLVKNEYQMCKLLGLFFKILKNNKRLKVFDNYFVQHGQAKEEVMMKNKGNKGKWIRNMRLAKMTRECHKGKQHTLSKIREQHQV